MPIKKIEDVTPKAEETVFDGVDAQNDVAPEEVVEPKKEVEKEPSLPLSLVQKMMTELEDKLLNTFNSKISKIKTQEAKEEMSRDLEYVQDLEDDWLDTPVVFFAYSFNFSIHGDKRRGEETEPPHGAIKFKPLIRTKRKTGKQTQVVSVSSVKIQSRAEVDYLRSHSQYGIAFYENMESALNIDSTWAQKMVEAQQSISRLSDMQMIQRAKQEGVAITQSPESMRRQLIELIAKRSINQQDRLLYGNLKAARVDASTSRTIIEKTIG